MIVTDLMSFLSRKSIIIWMIIYFILAYLKDFIIVNGIIRN